MTGEAASMYAMLTKTTGESYRCLVGLTRVTSAPGEAKNVATALSKLREPIL